MPPYSFGGAPGRTRTCGPLLSFQHQAFPDRPFKAGVAGWTISWTSQSRPV